MKHSRLVLSLVDSWWSKHLLPLNYLLMPWSILYMATVIVRRFLYRLGIKKQTTFDVPVIIVGNIVVGGTGKTPLVIYLANLLKNQGYNPGIVSRGYGVKKIEQPITVLSHNDPSEVGDEPVLIASKTKCPIVVSADRVRAVEYLLKEHHCDIVLSDDGLQHYALSRDLEIVVVDGERRFGNHWCLPAGPLREPLYRLYNVDWIVCNGKPFPKSSHFYRKMVLMNLSPLKITAMSDPNKHLEVTEMKDEKIHAIAGIGNPKRFFMQLKALGLNIIEHALPDHYRFTRKEIDFGADSKVIMTEKDAVKCQKFSDERHYYLPVQAELSEEFEHDFLMKVSLIFKNKEEKL